MKKIVPFLNNSDDIIVAGRFDDKEVMRFDDEMIVSRYSAPVGSSPKPALVPGGSN